MAALVHVTVMTSMALASSCIAFSRKLRADCRIFSLIMDPGCPFPEIRAVQLIKTYAAASEDRVFPHAPRRTDSHQLCCPHCWSWEAGNTGVLVSRNVVSRPVDQRVPDNAPNTVYPYGYNLV